MTTCWWACLATFVLLLSVHAPDAGSDARVGKKTLTVRLGKERSARLHRAATAAVIISIVVLAGWRPGWSTALALSSGAFLSLATWLIAPDPQGTRANLLTFSAVASLVFIGLGLGLGTLLDSA